MVTRIEEAQALRKQGLVIREIAEQMSIREGTVSSYLYLNKEAQNKRQSRLKKKQFIQGVREQFQQKLMFYGLPLEWEDELVQNFIVYHDSKAGKGRGRKTEIDVLSLIQLFCRRHRIPTPRKLEIKTYQGRGSYRQDCGYTDTLSVLDGVTIAKPIEYIETFVGQENLDNKILERAEKLLDTIPKMSIQGKNPRSIAGAVLYEVFNPLHTGFSGKRIYTQRYIADRLRVTEPSLRINWKRFFCQQD